jgi:hypothetical protein
MVQIGETFNGRWDWGVFGRCAYVSLGGKANTDMVGNFNHGMVSMV